MERGRVHPRDLDATRKALAIWRRDHGGVGRRIPDTLWAAAADVARTAGVEETGRALRLNAAKLSAFVAARSGEAAGPPGREPASKLKFVELDGVELGAAAAAGGVVIRMLGREGNEIRVDVPRDASCTVVVELARAFWDRRV